MTPAASPPVGSAEATTPTPPLADLTITTGPWMKTTFELACHYFVVVEEGLLTILSPAPHSFQNQGVWLCFWLTLSLPESSYFLIWLWFCQRTLSKGSLGSQKYSFRDVCSPERCTRSLNRYLVFNAQSGVMVVLGWNEKFEFKQDVMTSNNQMGNTFPRNRMSCGVLRAVKGLAFSTVKVFLINRN